MNFVNCCYYKILVKIVRKDIFPSSSYEVHILQKTTLGKIYNLDQNGHLPEFNAI